MTNVSKNIYNMISKNMSTACISFYKYYFFYVIDIKTNKVIKTYDSIREAESTLKSNIGLVCNSKKISFRI